MAQGDVAQENTGESWGQRAEGHRPHHWTIPEGVRVKCDNGDCSRRSELANEAGWKCPECGTGYAWGLFWKELCEARRRPTVEEQLEEGAEEEPKAPYTGSWKALLEDDDDCDDDAPAAASTSAEKPKNPVCQYKAPDADAADKAAKEAEEAWRKVHEGFKKKRTLFQKSQGKLQYLLKQVQEQLDWMDKQKGEVADIHAEVEVAATNFSKKTAEQNAVAAASVQKISNTMDSARAYAATAKDRYEEKPDTSVEDLEIERLKKEVKEAKVRRVKQEEQAADRRAAAKASAEEARKEEEARESRLADERTASEALERALDKAGKKEVEPAGVVNCGSSSTGAAAAAPAAAAADIGTVDAEIGDACIEVGHNDAAKWKEAMVHWIWEAGEDEEVQAELLQWTRVGHADDESNAKGFEDGAKAARNELWAKRKEHMAAAEQVRALAEAGLEEGARQLAWDTEVYSSRLREQFRSWIDTALDARLGELLQKRSLAVEAGGAQQKPAFKFSTTPKDRGFKKKPQGRKPGTQLVAEVADAKTVAKGDKFTKRKPATATENNKDEDEE